MTADDEALARWLAKLSGGSTDAELDRRVNTFQGRLRRLREDPAEAARIDEMVSQAGREEPDLKILAGLGRTIYANREGMDDERSIWSSAVFVPGAELIIGWRPLRSRLDAAAVELSAEVAAELRCLCVNTLEQLAGLTRRDYGGSPYIEPDEEYLAVPTTQLPRGGGGPADSLGGEDDTGLSDLERLIATPGLPAVSAEDLREGRYLCYAVICTDRRGRRIGFVRQADPRRAAKAGGLMALLGGEGLRELADPVFIFEASFDLVVSPSEIAVLRLEAFNRMFADLHTLAAAAPANAKTVSASVDRMSTAAVDALARAAAARPSLARQLQRLTRPGATPQVTPGDLAAAMAKHSLDPAGIVQGGEVVFAEDSAGQFLDLLEQLYYETDFTGEHRRSDRYSPLKRVRSA